MSLVYFVFSLGHPSAIYMNFSDGRHFKPVYGKDYVDSLLASADQVMAGLERSAGDQLSSHQNRSTCLQGQIDLIRCHQVAQDQRISYAVAREAEVSDGRLNERLILLILFFF